MFTDVSDVSPSYRININRSIALDLAEFFATVSPAFSILSLYHFVKQTWVGVLLTFLARVYNDLLQKSITSVYSLQFMLYKVS